MQESSNPGKNLVIKVGNEFFVRIPIKTRLITSQDTIEETISQYLTTINLKEQDIIFISEKIIAILQKRAFPVNEVKASSLAKFLSKFVSKRPGGIGLAMPETMQIAIDEVGFFRIFLALLGALITKPFGIKGFFYIIAGDGARAIDGPTSNTIPPYNRYIVKGPKNPNKIAENIAEVIKRPVAIVDANDRGIRVLGISKHFNLNKKLVREALKDNPLGQSSQSTPIGILRPVDNEE